jgi:hypothetical protein
MKRLLGLVLAAGLLASLGGCVYGPGYYQRPGVVYDNGGGNGAVDASDSGYAYDSGYDYSYGPGYYPGYYAGYYDPWCCYGGPFFGLGFYGSYGFHGDYHGPYRGGPHGGFHGGGYHGGSHSGGGTAHGH